MCGLTIALESEEVFALKAALSDQIARFEKCMAADPQPEVWESALSASRNVLARLSAA